jgi:hypothetical protein
MINKNECLPQTKVVINNKQSKWNESMGTSVNGLVGFFFKKDGVIMGEEFEIEPGTVLEILGPPRKSNESGTIVKYTIDGSKTVFASWWVTFKHKVDKV